MTAKIPAWLEEFQAEEQQAFDESVARQEQAELDPYACVFAYLGDAAGEYFIPGIISEIAEEDAYGQLHMKSNILGNVFEAIVADNEIKEERVQIYDTSRRMKIIASDPDEGVAADLYNAYVTEHFAEDFQACSDADDLIDSVTYDGFPVKMAIVIETADGIQHEELYGRWQ